MTERISWETCPDCGGRVAVGWQRADSQSSGGDEVATEYDCVNGCSLTWAQLADFSIVARWPQL